MKADLNEILRYLGAQQASEGLCLKVAAVSERLEKTLQPRFTYKVCPLLRENGQLSVPTAGITLKSRTAERMLAQCDQVILLACTLGAAFETMLRAEQARDMANAAILNACGSALVEAGCDAAEQELKARFPDRFLTDRFSPGYGDLPLSLQPAICSTLDVQRRLGIYLTDSCLMIPSKSVTALMGLSNTPQMARIRGCAYCSMQKTCTLRKGGKHCGI